MTEGRPGSAGAPRTLGGLGGHFGAPHVNWGAISGPPISIDRMQVGAATPARGEAAGLGGRARGEQRHLGESASTLPLYGYDAGLTLDVQRRVLAYGHVHEERLESEHLERLRRLEPLLDGVAVERAVRFGDVVEEVAREAVAFEADLIAVSERRRPWWRPVLTRFVDRVRARARAPILTLSGAAR